MSRLEVPARFLNPNELHTWEHAVRTAMELPGPTTFTLLALLEWMNRERADCYPCHYRIAAITKCSERSVRRHLAEAEARGYLFRVEGATKKGVAARYRACIPLARLDEATGQVITTDFRQEVARLKGTRDLENERVNQYRTAKRQEVQADVWPADDPYAAAEADEESVALAPPADEAEADHMLLAAMAEADVEAPAPIPSTVEAVPVLDLSATEPADSEPDVELDLVSVPMPESLRALAYGLPTDRLAAGETVAAPIRANVCATWRRPALATARPTSELSVAIRVRGRDSKQQVA